jgi:ABC-type Mn2+/Zn2+ transport system ATPase subunit
MHHKVNNFILRYFCYNELDKIPEIVFYLYPWGFKGSSLFLPNGVELDYLFPVRTLHETPEDVSVCSSGQKEIIDLAFREAGMRCLGLSTHPILFDEWGVRMDETHKQKTAVLLSELTEQTRHDQIVMVSHQNVVHDSFTDIRRLVLCDKNIVIDGEYNDHVLIEK